MRGGGQWGTFGEVATLSLFFSRLCQKIGVTLSVFFFKILRCVRVNFFFKTLTKTVRKKPFPKVEPNHGFCVRKPVRRYYKRERKDESGHRVSYLLS